MARRVVITGLGTINPLGADVRSFWDGLKNGRSGIWPIERFNVLEFKVRFGGEVKGFGPESLLEPIGLGGFIAARSLSLRNDSPQTASRPFDRDRDGFVPLRRGRAGRA